jgi:hypothetical protein
VPELESLKKRVTAVLELVDRLLMTACCPRELAEAPKALARAIVDGDEQQLKMDVLPCTMVVDDAVNRHTFSKVGEEGKQLLLLYGTRDLLLPTRLAVA